MKLTLPRILIITTLLLTILAVSAMSARASSGAVQDDVETYLEKCRESSESGDYQELAKYAHMLARSARQQSVGAVALNALSIFCILVAVGLLSVLGYESYRVRNARKKLFDLAAGTNAPTSEKAPELPRQEEMVSNDDEVGDQLLYRRIETLMLAQAPFTDPACDLTTIANLTGSNRSYVSRAINKCSGLNFPAWIAKYRVDMAIRLLLADPDSDIADIYMEVGYENRSTFERNFIKITGLSPGQFRKIALN